MIAKNIKTTPGPMVANSTGTNDGTTAANTQCTELPKDCPKPLKWFGKISDIKTQITVPCPIACDAMNMNKNMGIEPPFQSKKNAADTNDNEII